jgi:hypothetical protein
MLTALLWPGLTLNFAGGWPPSLRSAAESLLKSKNCTVEGADAISVSESSPGTFETIYVPWYSRGSTPLSRWPAVSL